MTALRNILIATIVCPLIGLIYFWGLVKLIELTR